jgi:hypothetical protein
LDRAHGYRRDFTAPSDEETDVDETLISLDGIEGFLNRSIEKLGKLHRTLKNVRFGGFCAFFGFLRWIPIGF